MQTGNDLNIIINNLTVSYDDNGLSTLPIIFIHGFPFDKNSWLPQVEALKANNRVINYDIRGFGKSTSGSEEFTIELFADDLIKFMDALKIERAIVCGLSMGGYILLNAINRFPERFKALILADTQCIADTPEGREKRFKTIGQIEANGLEEFATGFVKNVFCASTIADKQGIVHQIKNTILTTSPQSVIATLKALAGRAETCSILDKISIPVLILCGKEDIITPPERSEFLKQNIQGAKLMVIDNAAHLSNLEQPEIFNDHLNKFVATILN